jgi:glycosyltransferase involved in cell wall biosynthesis
LGYGPEDQVLLTVGALTPEKGHAVMLGALALLAHRHPRLRWVCAGEGPLLPSLIKESVARGVRDRIQFLGQRDDVPDLLTAIDAVVFPSLNEGLCTAAIQALYARAPLVLSDAGGLQEIAGVDDPAGPVARVTPVGDSVAVAAAIEDVIASPQVNRRLTDRGFERVNRLFTVERMVAETLAVFRDTLSKNLRRRG